MHEHQETLQLPQTISSASSQLPAIRSGLSYPESGPSKLSHRVCGCHSYPANALSLLPHHRAGRGACPLVSPVLDSACVNVPLALSCTAGLPSAGPAISMPLLVPQFLCL